jgi:integral membrane protein
MALAPKPADVPRVRAALTLYRITSIITGSFLLLLVVMMVLRYLFLVDIGTGGAYGALYLEPRESITEAGGIDISTLILIAHGWFYVLYLISDFRLWSLMRWRFRSFLLIALGGVVPFLSFIVERFMHSRAVRELAAIEAAASTVEAKN